MKLFSGTNSKYFSEKVANSLNINLGDLKVEKFKDGEMMPSFKKSIRAQDVYIIQSTFAPTDNLFELLLISDAAKRASSGKIIAVIPYFGYARQDRKSEPRVPISAKLVANLLRTAGIDRIITMDLHADQIQGFFNIPVDHLYASTIFIPYMQALNSKNLIIASPDTGGTKRAKAYANHLGVEMVICYKHREKSNEVASLTVIGDVKGKDVIIVDDMIDTAGTLAKATDMLIEKGAKTVRAFITHPVLSGNAYENIENSKLTELVVTDSIPLKQKCDKIKVMSAADLFGAVIKSVENNESISKNFILV